MQHATPTLQATDVNADQAVRTYVIDTSVLLSDPRAVLRFAEHNVVVPIVVITELESKRHHPELGYFARTALRLLDDLREQHGRLDTPMAINDQGGNLRIELNHTDQSALPSGFRLGDNDTRILAVALNYSGEGHDVVLVTKDVPLRVKAAAVGLAAEDYRNDLARETDWTGMSELAVTSDDIARLYDEGQVHIDGEEADAILTHSGVRLSAPGSTALGRKLPDGSIKLVKQDREVFGLRGHSAEQRVALDLLMDDEVGIVSLGGRAGTGKSALALCAGLEAVLEQRRYSKVMVFRPLYPVGGQELGYLPGTAGEKMQPWGQAVFDTLGAVTNKYVIDELLEQEMIEVLPLTHIRGRSLHDAFIIVDEAQSLERNVLLTVLSRVGQNSRVVLTHDVAQRDNLRVGRHDGIVSVIEKLKGNPLFAHIKLVRSERSQIAALVTELLGEDIA